MNGIILCRSEEAAKPYYMCSLGVNVYSLEELCYNIYNNLYLLSSDFVDEEMIRFLKEQTGDNWLADELTFLKEKNAGLREIVITILLYADYYTKDEIDEARGLIDSISSLKIEERYKKRADNFLMNEKYESAIKNYMMILHEEEHLMKDEFYGNVLHNIGVAYGRMFLFEQASECFKSAYEMNLREESLREYYMAAALAGVQTDENITDEALKSECVGQMDELAKSIMDSPEYIEIARISQLRNEGNMAEYNEGLKKVFDRWKADYVACMK
ncbi:MAG: hypothetical protein ACI4AQ_05590 [Lachnospiraceae bacterium]